MSCNCFWHCPFLSCYVQVTLFLLFVSFGVVWSFLALSRPVLGAIVMSCVVSLFLLCPHLSQVAFFRFPLSRSFSFSCFVVLSNGFLFRFVLSRFVSLFGDLS